MWVDYQHQHSSWVELYTTLTQSRLLRFAFDMLRLYYTQPWEAIE
jgi:hypothetical protein